MWQSVRGLITGNTDSRLIPELIELELRDTPKWKSFEQKLESVDFDSRSSTIPGRTELIKVWESEFAFRGFGPFESRKKAENELRIVQLYRQALLFYKTYTREMNSLISNANFKIVRRIKTIRLWISFWLLVSIIYSLFLGPMALVILEITTLFAARAISAVVIRRINSRKLSEFSPQKLARMRAPSESRFIKSIAQIATQLMDLDKSELFDDSDMRVLIVDWSQRQL